MTMLVHTHFTTRLGGVSQPPYDSLNLGAHVGDDPDAVRENRARVAAQLNLDPARFIWMDRCIPLPFGSWMRQIWGRRFPPPTPW